MNIFRLASGRLRAVIAALALAAQPALAANYPNPTFKAPASGVPQSLAYRGAKHVLATDYSSGSNYSTTGATTLGSCALTVGAIGDFVNGEGIAVSTAGPAPIVSTPISLSAVQQGTAGTTTLTYKVASVDAKLGISAVATVTITNGNVGIYPNNVLLSWTDTSGAPSFLVWKSTNSGPYVYIGYSGPSTVFADSGYAIPWRGYWVPAGPPSAPINEWLITSIVSGANSTTTSGDGTNSLQLATCASNTVAGVLAQHDDTAALNAMLVLYASTGVFVELPCGVWNITGSIIYTGSYQKLVGNGRCSTINPLGVASDIIVQGPAIGNDFYGDSFNDLYVPEYNKVAGAPIFANNVAQIEYNNIYVDHPAVGPLFQNFNDLRMEHARITGAFQYGGWSLRMVSGAGVAEAACCAMLIDDYVNANWTGLGVNNGGRVSGSGIQIDGNIATITGYNTAVSDVEGKGWMIFNDTGNAGNPEFISFADAGSEFSMDNAIYMTAGFEIHFRDAVLHGAANTNSNVYIGPNVQIWSFEGGRNGNASCNGFDIAGRIGTISNMTIINNSASNLPGGTSGVCHGIVLEATSDGIGGSNNFIGKAYGVSWQQGYPINTVAGAGSHSFTGGIFEGNVHDYEFAGAGYDNTRVFSGISEIGPSPTYASGFGAGGTPPSVLAGGTPWSFKVYVGSTANTASGVVNTSLYNGGWKCHADDLNNTQIRIGVGASTTTITLFAYNGSTSTVFGAGDIIAVSCDH